MIHNLTHDEYATEYVKGVREANPQEYPTWEMLEHLSPSILVHLKRKQAERLDRGVA